MTRVFGRFIVAGAGLPKTPRRPDARVMLLSPIPANETRVTDASPTTVNLPPAFNADVPHAATDRPLEGAARRALLEAAERRRAAARPMPPTEHGGPAGLEPTRYGDWEKKGLAIDF